MIYITKLSWLQDNEKGEPVKKSKKFYVDAVSVSDAENKLITFSSEPQLLGSDNVTFHEPNVGSSAELSKVREFVNYDDNSYNWWEVELGEVVNEKGKLEKFTVLVSGDKFVDVAQNVKKRYDNYKFLGFKLSNNIVDNQLVKY